MKKVTFIFMFVLVFNVPFNQDAKAVRVVIDPFHIAETVTAYAQQLKDYVQLVQTTILNTSQLAQLYLDYQQVMAQYTHFLDQIRDLKEVLSPAAWQQLITDVNQELNKISDFSLTRELDPSSGSFDDDLRAVLYDEGQAPMEIDDVVGIFDNDFDVSSEDSARIRKNMEKIDRNYRRFAAQHENAAIDMKWIKDHQDKLVMQQQYLESLGEQSDLATLQFVAAQQILQMKQMNKLIEQQAKQMQHYEPMSKVANQIEADEIEAQIKELQRVKNTPPALSGRDSNDCLFDGTC